MTFKVLKPGEAASALGVSVNTLEKWRCRGTGPKYVRIGTARIGYLEEDLRSFITESSARRG